MTDAIFNDAGFATTAGTTTIYHYDKKTGEYRGETEEFVPAGVSIPANSTTIAPGDAVAGYVRVFSAGAWNQAEDHRSETVYSTDDAHAIVIKALGPYPDDTTTLSPEGVPFPVWGGESWATDAESENEQMVRQNTATYNRLLAAALSTIGVLNCSAAADKPRDGDADKLLELQQYVDQLRDVDPMASPMALPPQPASLT